MSAALRLGLFGCPLDTGNLGVSALGVASVRGLSSGQDAVGCTLFDYGRGRRSARLRGEGWSAEVELFGSAYSRRYYRLGNQQQLHLAARLGLAGLHPVLADLARLDAILDVSGGDSFSDLYGHLRYRAVAMPKRLALALGRPLILLPQTLGPFRDPANRDDARQLLAGARQVWTRDAQSLELAHELLGADFDPARHRQGIDVAFGLPVREPEPAPWREALERFAAGGERLLGLNTSGLLYNRPGADRRDFGLRPDYRELMQRLLARLLAEPETRVLLVPHVVPPCLPEESDDDAHRSLLESLDESDRRRVFAVPPDLDASTAKWLVGRCAWFCGTRMHACIAGLSQGVPTVGLAYSDKAEGVFDTVGAGDWVLDTRRLGLEELVEGAAATLADTAPRADSIRSQLPTVRKRLAWQFDEMLDSLRPAPSGRSAACAGSARGGD